MFTQFNQYHALVVGYIVLAIFAFVHPEKASDIALLALGGTWLIMSYHASSSRHSDPDDE